MKPDPLDDLLRAYANQSSPAPASPGKAEIWREIDSRKRGRDWFGLRTISSPGGRRTRAGLGHRGRAGRSRGLGDGHAAKGPRVASFSVLHELSFMPGRDDEAGGHAALSRRASA